MRRSLTILLLISSFSISSCVDHGSTQDSRPDAFCYNEPDGIGSLDPAVASYQAAWWATTHLFNGLVELDTALQIVPSIARSWSVDDRGLEWTFHLRTDVWFHEDPCFGAQRRRRVTAHDVRYSLERICDARTKSTGQWAFRDLIDGAIEFIDRSKFQVPGSKFRHIAGLNVLNDSTIVIRLTKPFAPFLAVLTMPYGSIVPREAIEHYGADFGQHPVGTGPFRFDHWKQDIECVLVRNEHYFKVDDKGRKLPYLNTVRITFLRDIKSEFLEFVRGTYDVVSNIDGSFAPSVYDVDLSLKAPYDKYVMHKAPAFSIEYYGVLLDTSYPAAKAVPLATRRKLRQAMNYAIDRHRIVTYVLHGRGRPARHGVLPPGMPGFSESVQGYSYDIDKARRLLAEAGFPNGKGCPPLLLQLGNNPRTASVAEAIQEQWKEIGLNVELRQIDFPQHLAQVRNGELAMWRTSWIGDYPDPENFLALFITKNMSPFGPNTTHISREELDALYEQALDPRLTTDERNVLYNQMERIVIEESPWMFLYHDVLIRLTHPNIRNFTLDGSGRLLLEHVFKTSH
jgi:oligopeptide transport system substrate-binding protein